MPAQAEVIDRVVAVVEEQLITASDVALEGDILRYDASPVPFWSRRHGDALHRLIDAAVIRELTGDVALYRPTDEQVGARVEAMRDRFDDRARWQAFLSSRGLDEDGLRVLIERRMIVESYLTRNIAIPVSQDDAFVAAVEALLDPVEKRLRIREVPPS